LWLVVLLFFNAPECFIEKLPALSLLFNAKLIGRTRFGIDRNG